MIDIRASPLCRDAGANCRSSASPCYQVSKSESKPIPRAYLEAVRAVEVMRLGGPFPALPRH